MPLTDPTSASTLSRISRAALLVKVTARIAQGLIPRSLTMYAMRWVMVPVLPLPAPASMRRGPTTVVAASRCCLLSLSRYSGMDAPFRKVVGIIISHQAGERGTDIWGRDYTGVYVDEMLAAISINL